MDENKKECVYTYYGLQKKVNSNGEDCFIEDLNGYVRFLETYVEKVANRADYKQPGPKYVFRGMSNASQKYSGVTNQFFKGKDQTKDFLFDKDYIENFNKEILLIRKFQHNAPNVAFYNALDLVAMAQHNLLKTRFIDWTYSPLVATLFSLFEAPDELKKKYQDWCGYYLVAVTNINQHVVAQGLSLPPQRLQNLVQSEQYMIYEAMLNYLTEVYLSKDDMKIQNYINSILLNTNTTFLLTDSDNGRDMYKTKNKDLRNKLVNKFKNKMFFLETNFANTRIAAQRGLFQLSVSPYQQYIDKFYKENIDYVFISQKVRNKILKYCNILGMNNYALMPDRQSIALGINKKYNN